MAAGSLEAARGARLVFNDRLDAVLALAFMLVTALVVAASTHRVAAEIPHPTPTGDGQESPFVETAWGELERVLRVVRRVSGVPTTPRTVEHARRCHPGQPLPSERDYYEEYVRARYEGGPTRCC